MRKEMNDYTLPSDCVLCLRTNNSNMTSYNKFVWPKSGEVHAPDWVKNKSCGNGLHGLLWGSGDGQLLNWAGNAKWLVVEVKADTIVNLVDKVKFPSGNVVYYGNRSEATEFIAKFSPDGTAIVGRTMIVDDMMSAIVGDYGTATAGNGGTATAGYNGTATAGYQGTAQAGDYGILQFKFYADFRERIIIGYVGENGIMPNVKYKLVDARITAL